MDLSIIIPAYNEAKKIPSDIRSATEFLEVEPLSGEIIVVDDGSYDETGATAKATGERPDIPLHVFSYTPNRGKGFAVRTGMAHSSGQLIMFADSGVCVPFSYALRGMELILSGECHLAHGSRKLPGSVIHHRRPLYRRIVSDLFVRVLHAVVGIPGHLTDTQCGFKLYHGEIGRELYSACTTDGFMFEIELILMAEERGYVIREFPVEWSPDPDTRISPLRHPPEMLWELRQIYARFR